MHKSNQKGDDRDIPSASAEQIRKMTYPQYVEYLLRLGAFKTMSELARDMGVPNGYVRQIKNRATVRGSERVRVSNGVQRVF